MALLREAADWLTERGNLQWQHWYMDFGERLLRERLEHHEVYLLRLDKIPVGTLTLQWSDPEVWGERGLDGLAGYIHGMGVARTAGGRGEAARILDDGYAEFTHRLPNGFRTLGRLRMLRWCKGGVSSERVRICLIAVPRQSDRWVLWQLGMKATIFGKRGRHICFRP